MKDSNGTYVSFGKKNHMAGELSPRAGAGMSQGRDPLGCSQYEIALVFLYVGYIAPSLYIRLMFLASLAPPSSSPLVPHCNPIVIHLSHLYLLKKMKTQQQLQQ